MLSKRLKTIANQIQKGQTMADVGTDHGFLPLYLWKNGVCPKVIMTDVSEPSLNKAKEAFETYLGDFHFRCGDGLEVIEKGEVDVVVIAGMGGVLMTHILGSDLTKTLSFKKYVLQPRNGSGKLRFWLEKTGFKITSECLAEESKFICEILIVTPPVQLDQIGGSDPIEKSDPIEESDKIEQLLSLDDYPDEIKYEIPRNLQPESENLFKLFITKKTNIEKNILNAMIGGKIADEQKVTRIRKRIEFLEENLR